MGVVGLFVFSILATSFANAQEVLELPELEPVAQEQMEADVNIDNIDEVLREIEATAPTPMPIEPEPSASTEIVPIEAPIDIITPEAQQLEDPSVASERAAREQEINIPEIPAVGVSNAPQENLFYDAESLAPSGELVRRGGAPRKLDPKTEPGSKLILVRKNFSANSQKAEIIAAQRAMKLGRYASALEMYESLYVRNKRDPNILIGRAEAYQRLGQDDFAIQAYEELLDLRPNNVQARINMLGIIGKKFPAVALRQLIDLREDHPDNVGIVAQLAVVQGKMGSHDEALRYLGIAASMEPQNPTHIFNMAVIADTAGDRNNAIEFYEQALELDTLYGGGKILPRGDIFERLASLR